MAQKSDKDGGSWRGGGGGGGEERQRNRETETDTQKAEIWREKKEEEKVQPWKKKFPVPNTPGDEWENQSTHAKNA